MFIDTHSHIYLEEFATDLNDVIWRAKKNRVKKIILPNIDSHSLLQMRAVEECYPDFCFAAIGLHPTSVLNDYKTELAVMERELQRRKYIAIGEIGIDLHWDRSYYKQQVIALQVQVTWALAHNLPIIIHVRDSFKETIEALKPFRGRGLKGVFHCFTGGLKEAEEIFDLGDFMLGIGGVVTFKNAQLADNLKAISLKKIVLETDSPYLTPSPHRGKRNEPAYVSLIGNKLSEIYGISSTEVAAITTQNAEKLFFSNCL